MSACVSIPLYVIEDVKIVFVPEDWHPRLAHNQPMGIRSPSCQLTHDNGPYLRVNRIKSPPVKDSDEGMPSSRRYVRHE
jgi:hypothetical protein